MSSELTLYRKDELEGVPSSNSASNVSIDDLEGNCSDNGNGTSSASFKPKLTPQLIATLIACIGAWNLGTVIGWTSPAIPDLKRSGHLGHISVSAESWIGSASTAGAAFSGLFVGFLMGKVGRKLTILILQLPCLLGWILIITSSNMGMVIAGRFLAGFSGGAMTLIVPVYVSEICQDKIRGALSAFMSVYLVTGILFAYSLGSFLSWFSLSLACAAVPILGCSIVFMPDSPTSLLSRNKAKDAQKALQWFRGAKNFMQVEAEFKEVEFSVNENMQNSARLKDLLVPSVLKPVAISLALFFFQEFGGITAVAFNAESIFESAGSHIDSSLSAIIIGVVQLIATIVTVTIVDRLGRKPLLIFAEITVAICLTTLGTFFYFKIQNDGETPAGYGWVPLVCLIGYMIAYSIGLNPLTAILLSELAPSHVKGLAGGIGNSFYWSVSFIVTLTFSQLISTLGEAGCYWFYAGISCVGALFVIFIVPETKGKSLDEIDSLFR